MAIRIVRLGTARLPSEGLRIGIVRRVPRGVPKTQYAQRNFFDLWLPELAPSGPLVSWALAEPFTPKRWAAYTRNYRREMRSPTAQRLMRLLATLSATTDFSVGCYCQDAEQCHRRILKELLLEQSALIADDR